MLKILGKVSAPLAILKKKKKGILAFSLILNTMSFQIKTLKLGQR